MANPNLSPEAIAAAQEAVALAFPAEHVDLPNLEKPAQTEDELAYRGVEQAMAKQPIPEAVIGRAVCAGEPEVSSPRPEAVVEYVLRIGGLMEELRKGASEGDDFTLAA